MGLQETPSSGTITRSGLGGAQPEAADARQVPLAIIQVGPFTFLRDIDGDRRLDISLSWHICRFRPDC